MEASLRLFLLLMGVVIVVGIIWDFRRNRGTKEKKEISKPRTDREHFVSDDLTADVLKTHHFDELSTKDRVEEPEAVAVGEGEIIVLQIMARHPNQFLGRKLLDVLNECHLYFGDMQIFHRYENIDGTGNVIFSLASAVEPGYFELSKMADLRSPGLTLFFTTTRPNQSIAAFELMLRTAKQLAQRLEGELKDDKHRPLTPLSIENYRDRVRSPRSPSRAMKVS